jgi:hypothetical protein
MGLFALPVLLYLFLSMNVQAQNRDTVHKDTSVKIVIRDPVTNADSKILLIIDDKMYYTDSFNSLLPDTSNILNVKVLKGNESTDKYGKQGMNGTILIITKKYATKQYQKRFSAFSKKYKDYLMEHNKSKDDSCSYVLNGTFLLNGSNEKIEKLYNIKSQGIKGIGIAENPGYNGDESRKYLVLINTKQ